MYRLLNYRSLSLTKIHNTSFKLNNLNNDSLESKVKEFGLVEKQISYNRSFIRFQSTSKAQPTTKHKRKKTPKKYYDLLVVSDNSIKQEKTLIKKLKWSDLQLLATTNLRLSELYKLKDLSKSHKFVEQHTYNNLTVIDHVPPDLGEPISNKSEKIISCDIPNDPSILNEPVILSTPNFQINTTDIVNNVKLPAELAEEVAEIEAFQPEIAAEQELRENEMIEEAEEEEIEECIENISKKKPHVSNPKAKLEIATRTLGSYLEICSILRNPQRGLNALNFHNNRANRGNKYFNLIRDVRVYNALLKGFANKGDVNKIEEIVQMMKKERIQLVIQSYAAIFECWSRLPDGLKDNNLKMLRTYAYEAIQNDCSFDKIMNYGKFVDNERQLVLEAMKRIDPTYVPTYEKPQVQYNNHLVDTLNDEEQNYGKIDDFIAEKPSTIFTKEKMKKMVDEQLKLEQHGYVVVKSIEARGKVSDEVMKHRQCLADHYKYWESCALNGFKRDLFTLTAQRSPLNDEPYLRCIPVKDYITIIVDEAKKIAEGSETYSPTTNQLYRELGNKVYTRFQVLRKQKTGVLDKVLKIHNKYSENYVLQHGELDVLPNPDKPTSIFNPRQKWQWIEHDLIEEGATISMDHREWSPSVLQNIGKFLYGIVMHDLKVDANAMRLNNSHKNYVPAFYTIFRTQGRIVKEEVKPHPVLHRLYRGAMPETLTFPTNEVPMKCPPVPWTRMDSGGYLISPCDVVRLPTQATSQKMRMRRTDQVQLYPSFDALNQLSAVPWKVNTDILDVILEVFNKGGSSKLDVPEPPSSLPPPPSISSCTDKAQKYKLFKEKLQYRRKKAEMYSLWCDCLYRLSLANHFRDDIFWLPHNMDFRGRVYPVPPHLNHLGSDLARSMLVFAETRPLGREGLDWLKIHLINLTGLKKRDSINDRLKYANEIIDDILDSADRPLTGKMWWADSDEPWQTLACCMEIAKAIRSGNPEEYRSSFPIHQDGSCNGLQHYAALGRDSAGAYSVNLCSSSTPQDVYSAVVTLVEEQRRKDAENGVEIAKILDGFVSRKVIKQTIMTTVYGVTRFGARLQIAKQLKDLDKFPKDAVWNASSYLTGRTFDSLRTMFTSTREIQDWFTDCARLISAVSGKHVEWITPMGLPVVQPYFRYKALGTSMVYKPFHMDHHEKPNVMKQKNAFPPNFIHSLDSSHMMLTSLYSERAGITFVSVHDCYWTHPSTVHIMNKICREQFVALHSEPILENLSEFLSQKYSYNDDEFADDGSVTDLTKKKLNRILRQLPKTGDFDINQVLRSVYFFS